MSCRYGTQIGVYRDMPCWTLDLRSLALFRICFGIYLLYDIYSRLYLEKYDLAWYTTPGFLAPHDSPHQSPLHRLWFGREYALWKFGIATILAICYTLGKWQKRALQAVITKVGLYVIITAIQCSNMESHDGSDLLVRHLLVFSCFLPLSAVWSVDAHKTTMKAKTVSGLECLALTTQILLMYWGTMAHRTLDRNMDSQWLRGEAVHYALAGSFAVRSHFLVQWLQETTAATRLLTHAACFMETCIPFWCFTGNSVVAPVLMMSFHAGLWACFRLPNWQVLGMFMQVVWIPTWWWDSWYRDEYRHKKSDVDQSLKSEKATTLSIKRTHLAKFLLIFLYSYMIYNWAGNRGWIAKHDNGDIGEGLRLNQYWPMFSTVATKAYHGFCTATLKDGPRMDVFAYIKDPRRRPLQLQVDLNATTVYRDMSARYPSPRWERAVHDFGMDSSRRWKAPMQNRVRFFLEALCRILNEDGIDAIDVELMFRNYDIQEPGAPVLYKPYKDNPETKTTVRCEV